ncbi:uncharacterized protein LOC133498129 isoform X2 [Syngnathoides biaculeatus]|uniref:uncharacterized protein LOC133498129 isoform X2 n=1 Tax=Syngnathoides biaculeatus TaxID=300417 RepID=UPI002ADE3754|nr:uncharacterized protein LOC133498129 isoform X2 [Syngnathoides biaculeatus]
MATVGRMPSRTREEKLRQEGSGLPVWRTRPEQCACEEVLLCCKGFLGLGYKKKKSALVAATGCIACGEKKKKSDASRLAVPLQTHQMATVGRMPSRTRVEKLRQEGSGLPVWKTRPEQCACEEDLLWCLSSQEPAVEKKKKVMLRGWQYLCRPTRWRLWEGCRAGRERKNSVRKGQGFLSGRPVRNNAHARRPERRHLLEANESQTLRACGGKKKKVMLRGWQYLCRPTRWRLWKGCQAGQERKNSVRRGQGFLYGGPVRNNAHARRYFSAAKGFWASDEKKEIRIRSSHRVHARTQTSPGGQ